MTYWTLILLCAQIHSDCKWSIEQFAMGHIPCPYYPYDNWKLCAYMIIGMDNEQSQIMPYKNGKCPNVTKKPKHHQFLWNVDQMTNFDMLTYTADGWLVGWLANMVELAGQWTDDLMRAQTIETLAHVKQVSAHICYWLTLIPSLNRCKHCKCGENAQFHMHLVSFHIIDDIVV